MGNGEPGSEKPSIRELYDHLSEQARKLFVRMSFFPGGLSRELDLWELLGEDWTDAAEELGRQGIVRYCSSADRYTILDSARKFASAELDSGEGDGFRRQAAEFWADFARWHDLNMVIRSNGQESNQQSVNTSDDPEEQRNRDLIESEGFGALHEEADNLVYAAEWAICAEDEVGLGIVDSLADYLDLSDNWNTKEHLYGLALGLRRRMAENDPQEYMPDVATTLDSMGELLRKMGKFQKADTYLKEALGIYRKLSESQPGANMQYVANVLNNMGILHDDVGDYDEAMECYKEALEIRRMLFHRYPSAYALKLLSTLRHTMEVYEKLGMEEKATACREEIEEIEQLL